MVNGERMKLLNPLIVLDLETTGTWIEKDKIVEIAMIKCHTDGSQLTYERRLNPGIPIPKVISELIGITDQDIKNAPQFAQIAQEILDFIGSSDMAGFNVARFDLPLLEREFCDAGYQFSWRERKIYDAQRVYHLNEKRDLNAAYQFYCQKLLKNAHSAMSDVQATLEVLQSQVEKYGNREEGLAHLDKFQYRKVSEFFDREKKFRWWNGKLYPMFGKYARRLSLQEVAQRDPAYLEWVLAADFSDEVKGLVQDALKGKFPDYSPPVVESEDACNEPTLQ